MRPDILSFAKLIHHELVSSKTGEKFSHSAVLSEYLGIKNLFVHHEILPPGRRASAPHSHSKREEMIIVLKGRAIAHRGGQHFELSPDDFLGFQAGDSELHWIENTSSQDVHLLVIATASPGDEVLYHRTEPNLLQRNLPRLRTDRMILRLAEQKDIPKILEYFKKNKDHLMQTDPPKPEGFYTEQYWSGRVMKSHFEFATEQAVRLFLFDRNDDATVIGTTNFTQMARGPFQACYLGYAIDGDHEGKSMMTEALSVAIRYVFNELNFHRIMANHLPENERSARLLKRLGFVVEGKASNYLFINGKWRDHVMTSLTNADWKA